jgi:hypothetical protein
MKATALCGLGLVIGLAGCGPIQRAQQAEFTKERMATAKAEMLACKQQRRTSQVTYVETARCINDVQRRAASLRGYPPTLHGSALHAISRSAAHRGGS